MRRKPIIILGISVISVFLLFNIFWYYTTHKLYSPYKTGMEKIETFTYCSHDFENYGYLVGFPAYLHFNTGCLSITNADHNATLIIWPQYNNKEFEYGVLLTDLDNQYSIKMTKDGPMSRFSAS